MFETNAEMSLSKPRFARGKLCIIGGVSAERTWPARGITITALSDAAAASYYVCNPVALLAATRCYLLNRCGRVITGNRLLPSHTSHPPSLSLQYIITCRDKSFSKKKQL